MQIKHAMIGGQPSARQGAVLEITAWHASDLFARPSRYR